MNDKILEDLAEMKKKLSEYIDKGRVVGCPEVRKEPVIAVKPEKSRIKPLKRMKNCNVHFLAVDCSTRTLKRANNWGIYLMRAAYASVEERNVDWGYEERLCTVIGDAYGRSNFLKDFRIELESQMALNILRGRIPISYYDHTHGRSKYFLLDGGGYFGGERKFRVSLYEECKKEEIRLLAISKNSPLLHDEKGRDFVATTTMLSPYGMWVYHPIRKANKDQSLYGDVSIVKLCEESPRIFRCDIMDYLANYEIDELLSPLTSISEDPRCLGYPIALWLAHDFSTPSDSKLLHYHDQIEEMLASAGLLDKIHMEELSCSFPDELHGVRHAFEWEWIERV
ncbi:hypothetical protein DRO69_01570 [Candidatus Bathyarchaeota archaeon]|nr:MAG: hypothetical protein DRO69_01570 [Candidatus Bathyarchaeota archaeon]